MLEFKIEASHIFIQQHSLNKYLLNAYDIPGTNLSPKDLAINKRAGNLCLQNVYNPKSKAIFFHILKMSKFYTLRTFTYSKDGWINQEI